MEKRHKIYLKLNIMSIFFIAVSFISVSLAWFAYSGISNLATEIGVKAWYIELNKNGQEISNDLVISLSEIYPGMDTVNETVNIKNMGDLDAQIRYSIVSARILDDNNYTISDTVSSEYVEDLLSHEYPFHINITKKNTLAKGEESTFQVSISWPLDSNSDELDSLWGNKAYSFQKNEIDKHANDESYQIRPSIQIAISLKAEQYLGEDASSDPNYKLGDVVLFDITNNTDCSLISTTCLKTYVIDTNNKVGDQNVSLLPDPTKEYSSGVYNDYNTVYNSVISTWSVNTRKLLVNDILSNISTDIIDSKLIINGISDSIIGSLIYNDRINTELTKAINYNGYYSFNNNKFNFLTSDSCYWTISNYNTTNAFAINKIDENSSKVYGEDKNITCKVIPVIIADKDKLQQVN